MIAGRGCTRRLRRSGERCQLTGSSGGKVRGYPPRNADSRPPAITSGCQEFGRACLLWRLVRQIAQRVNRLLQSFRPGQSTAQPNAVLVLLRRGKDRPRRDADFFCQRAALEFERVDSARQFNPENITSLRPGNFCAGGKVPPDRCTYLLNLAQQNTSKLSQVAFISSALQKFSDRHLRCRSRCHRTGKFKALDLWLVSARRRPANSISRS